MATKLEMLAAEVERLRADNDRMSADNGKLSKTVESLQDEDRRLFKSECTRLNGENSALTEKNLRQEQTILSLEKDNGELRDAGKALYLENVHLKNEIVAASADELAALRKMQDDHVNTIADLRRSLLNKQG